MKKYLLIVLLVGVGFGNQRLNRIPPDALNLDQSDIRTNDFRNEEELLNFIDSTMETNFIPGLSISIAKGGNIVWNKHFGYTNINENILVDENTKFILSSASKTITATALMHLFQQNLFMLDDDVDNYLPFNINHPGYPEIPITFKMLLSHTSGIKDNWNFMPFYDGDSPIELNYYLNQYFSPLGEFYDSSLNFTDYSPGTGFSYSNIGAALVGLLVEEISNQSFNEFCIENIFEPLGMSDANWFLSEIENLNEVASPHQFADGSTDSLIVLENYGYSDYPAGQLRTTSNNLAKFMNLFINDGMYNGVEILSPETIELMKTIHYPNVAYDQGLIWYYKTLNERTLFGHGGSDKGSLTEMFISFSDNMGAVLLSNSRNHEGMAQIENAVFNFVAETDFATLRDLWYVSTEGSDETGDGSEWNPFATIQKGVNSSDNGDTIIVNEGTYIGAGIGHKKLTIGSSYILDENNYDIIQNTILDGESTNRLINLMNNSNNVTLVGLTIQNGYGNWGGAIGFSHGDTLTLKHCNLLNNTSEQGGGALNSNGGVLQIENCLFESNSSNDGVGAINIGNNTGNDGSSIDITIENSIFSNNVGSSKGAINIWAADSVYILGSAFKNNTAGGYAGGLNVTDINHLVIDDSKFIDNICVNGSGGGISVDNISTGIFSNNLIVGNISENGLGGGLCLWTDANMDIIGCTFADNSAQNSSEILIKYNSHCTITNSIIANDESASLIGLYDDYWEDIEEDEGSTLTISHSNVLGGLSSIYIDTLSSITLYDTSTVISTDPLFCNPDSSDFTLAENSPCVGTGQNNTNMGALGIGCNAFLSTINDIVPLQYSLHQNYPNPFNPNTSLRYDLPNDGLVNITIYDMMGRIVKTLVNGSQTAGFKTIQWNATNDRNEPVSAGLYLYTIQAGEFRQTKKMVLLK